MDAKDKRIKDFEAAWTDLEAIVLEYYQSLDIEQIDRSNQIIRTLSHHHQILFPKEAEAARQRLGLSNAPRDITGESGAIYQDNEGVLCVSPDGETLMWHPSEHKDCNDCDRLAGDRWDTDQPVPGA